MCTMTMTKRMTSSSTGRQPREATRDLRPPSELSAAQRRKVRRVRESIRTGEYENALKLAVTVDRLLDAVLCR
jgi:hypothetical protein